MRDLTVAIEVEGGIVRVVAVRLLSVSWCLCICLAEARNVDLLMPEGDLMKTCMALSSCDERRDLMLSVDGGRGVIVGEAGGEVIVARAVSLALGGWRQSVHKGRLFSEVLGRACGGRCCVDVSRGRSRLSGDRDQVEAAVGGYKSVGGVGNCWIFMYYEAVSEVKVEVRKACNDFRGAAGSEVVVEGWRGKNEKRGRR